MKDFLFKFLVKLYGAEWMHRFKKWLGKKNLGFHLATDTVHSK
jgi:hypothetical protein